MMRCLITFILLYLIDTVKADSAVAEYHIEKSNKFPCTYFGELFTMIMILVTEYRSDQELLLNFEAVFNL